ncbi:MAG: hypothetical protein AAF993_22705 [Pseudomonadota bacterium]
MIALTDLAVSQDLDSQAMNAVQGAGAWHKRYSFISTGSWGAYKRTSVNYRGIKFHDGYLHRHYIEGWKRSRTQTEYSSWNHYVKV